MPSHRPVTCAVVIAVEPPLPTGSSQPAVLQRVGGVSLLRRTVRVLGEAGVDRIIVVAEHESDAVASAIRDDDLPVELVVSSDGEQATSSAVVLALERVDDPRCLVVEGDRVFESEDVRRLVAAPGPNVLAVVRDAGRDERGGTGVSSALARTTSGGHVTEVTPDLDGDGVIDAGLSAVTVAHVLAAVGDVPAPSWADLRLRLVTTGLETSTCEFLGLWAAVDTPSRVRDVERALWHRYGPKPTDQIIARNVNRRISGPLTRLLLRTGLSPDVATLSAFATTLVAAGLIGVGSWWAMAAGGLGVMLGSALDGVDGELARVSGRASRRGAALDTLLDRYADLAVVLGLVVGAGASSSDWAWGFAAGCGCLLISYVHAVGRDTDVRLLFRREVRLLIFALAAIVGQPLVGLVVVAVAANLDTVRGVLLLLRAMRD